MKSIKVLLFRFIIFALIEFINADPTCSSKLDYLSLENINTQMEEYKMKVPNVITVLQLEIRHSVEIYQKLQWSLNETWQDSVQEFITFLTNHAKQRVKDNPKSGDEFYHCIQDSLDYISGFYQEHFRSSIENCMQSNIMDITDAKAASISLKTSALSAENPICDCVENIDKCSSKKKKSAAISCVNNAAKALNVDSVKVQADIILKQVQTLHNTTKLNLNSCLNEMPEVEVFKAGIIDKIDNCPIGTPI